jgi:hypothetical protein
MRPMLTIKCRTLIIVISVSSILTACVMPEAIPTASAPRIGSDPVSNATECESTFSYPNDSNGKPYVFCWQPYGSACATFVSGIRVALVQDSQARPPIVWPKYWKVDFDYYNTTAGEAPNVHPFVDFTPADANQIPDPQYQISIDLTEERSACTYGRHVHHTEIGPLPNNFVDIKFTPFMSYPREENPGGVFFC